MNSLRFGNTNRRQNDEKADAAENQERFGRQERHASSGPRRAPQIGPELAGLPAELLLPIATHPDLIASDAVALASTCREIRARLEPIRQARMVAHGIGGIRTLASFKEVIRSTLPQVLPEARVEPLLSLVLAVMNLRKEEQLGAIQSVIDAIQKQSVERRGEALLHLARVVDHGEFDLNVRMEAFRRICGAGIERLPDLYAYNALGELADCLGWFVGECPQPEREAYFKLFSGLLLACSTACRWVVLRGLLSKFPHFRVIGCGAELFSTILSCSKGLCDDKRVHILMALAGHTLGRCGASYREIKQALKPLEEGIPEFDPERHAGVFFAFLAIASVNLDRRHDMQPALSCYLVKHGFDQSYSDQLHTRCISLSRLHFFEFALQAVEYVPSECYDAVFFALGMRVIRAADSEISLLARRICFTALSCMTGEPLRKALYCLVGTVRYSRDIETGERALKELADMIGNMPSHLREVHLRLIRKLFDDEYWRRDEPDVKQMDKRIVAHIDRLLRANKSSMAGLLKFVTGR